MDGSALDHAAVAGPGQNRFNEEASTLAAPGRVQADAYTSRHPKAARLDRFDVAVRTSVDA